MAILELENQCFVAASLSGLEGFGGQLIPSITDHYRWLAHHLAIIPCEEL